MGTPRWQMREAEQQAMLEALFQTITDQVDDENEEWDPIIHKLACLVLRVLPAVPEITRGVKQHLPENDASWVGETHGQIVVHQLFEFSTPPSIRMRGAMMIATIARFSRTDEEAEMLTWRFFQKLCESLGSRFTRNYLTQTVHHPETVYGGPTMDDVPDNEEVERSNAIDDADTWVIKPT